MGAFQKIKKRGIILADVLPNNNEALLNYSGREFYLDDHFRIMIIIMINVDVRMGALLK